MNSISVKNPALPKDVTVAIVASGSFDEKFYKNQLKKHKIKVNNFVEHYILEGWRKGFDPHPCFCTSFYLQDNADVTDLNLHPFIHFVLYGFREDRKTHAEFSLTKYRARHPELSDLSTNPLAHYTKAFGQAKPENSQGPEIASTQLKQKNSSKGLKHLFDEATRSNLFDINWYQETYGRSFSSAYEGFTDYLHKSKFSAVNPSPHFDTEIYHRINGDVYHAQMSPLQHYLVSGKAEGRQYCKATQKWHPNSTVSADTSLTSEAVSLKIAVCLHIFYADYVQRFAHALQNFPTDVDLFITFTDPEIAKTIHQSFNTNPRIKKISTRLVPNRGRNFGPLLVEFSNELSGYDLFCHLHSKKSLYSGREQTQWADYLTEYLLQDTTVVTKVLNAFGGNRKFGIYYPTTFWMMPSWVNHVTMNRGYLHDLQDDLGLEKTDGFLNYPAGGMFWGRPGAISQILEKPYVYDDFPSEPLANDGSMLHALERVIGQLCEQNGYDQLFYYPPTGQLTKDKSYIVASYSNNIENVQTQLHNFSHISFDVFDTLLRREYTIPDYAKFLLGKELEKSELVPTAQDFVSLRNQCEADLRKRSNFVGDIRISDIYAEIGARLDLDAPDSTQLMQREFELDLQTILAKDEMVELFNSLGRAGHVLWVISDTYYSREQIGLMLRKVGITGNYRLLVSSEEQKRKDNGTMWQMVKADLALDHVDRYIHVGDNVVADAQIPGDLGLLTMHILHPLDKWKALGFPEFDEGGPLIKEDQVKKWGKLVSCVGRMPFL